MTVSPSPTPAGRAEIRPISDLPKTGRPLRGWQVLLTALGAFAVILTANITMVSSAIGSFPGLVAKNSYVASQQFNEAAAERARLGWRLTVGYRDGRLRLDARDAAGAPLTGLAVDAEIGLAVDARTDRRLVLIEGPDGYAAPIDLAPGQWRVQVDAASAAGDRMGGAAVVRVR